MKKKIIIIAVIIVIAIVGIIGYFAMSNLMQSITLTKEVDKVGKTDITKDDIDMTIKTKGDYGVVEKTIKEYINTYSNNCKEVMNIIQDGKLEQILTAENYQNDGPEFVNTKEYIANTKKEFNEKMNLLIDMTSKEKMLEAIQNKNLNEDFIKLYEDLMLGNETKIDLTQTVDALQETSTYINRLLDTQEKVIELLANNKGKWQVNNDQIEFETQKLVDEYNNIISGL